ncbi:MULTISPECIES: minor capsid protein [unclassified Lactobacillus]|uniref:minor capsid protein n=1 Tax=unclassified Lactobacillus TaxID=2620435 RepID=UPI00226A96D5|nr:MULTISPECIES: minor capsid protein [unclassified Lactobacillus]MCX8721332.1 minor capsid protein [Lactobacillus sp. B4010]MCX8732934.1 minor capsid protein [Lactobacillus sp. B4015]MCX8735587.1 minor capsid protein [Lactobacillus sp. B4012]
MSKKTRRSRSYWQKRFLQEKDNQLTNAAEFESAMRARLKEVQPMLEQEVEYWLNRYANNQEISKEDARKILSTIGTRDWHMTLKEYKRRAKEGGFDKELDAEYFKSQLSRLENIDEQLTNLLSQYANSESNKLEHSLSNQFQQTYMHSIYLTQLEKAKLSSSFANVNEYQVKAIVNKPWDGSNFSKRIWKNYTEVLPNELGDALLRGTVLGHSHEQVFQMMRQRIKDVEDYQLHRLVITEMGHIAETATADAYKEEGVEKYQYLATLESHTCEECAHLDGEIFDLKDRKDGINYPLIHPYCRCTTVPYIEGLPDERIRWSRDPETGKGTYVDNMTFDQWKKAVEYQRQNVSLPNNAARYISKKGNYNWNELNAEQYNKHIRNTPEYKNYTNGRKRPVSELTISSEEAQMLIDKYGKKRKNTDKNRISFNNDSYIGKWADIHGNLYPTKKGRISYRKNKGAHITPIKPDYLN